MNDLVKYSENSLEAIIDGLPIKEARICAALNNYNQLRNFKLDRIEILEWKDTLLRILPDLESEKLEFVIDRMIDGQITYKPEYGIKNLFIGLALIEKVENMFKIKEGEKIKVNWS